MSDEELVRPLTTEDEALITFFDELEKETLAFLDASGKRVLEMVTALFGLFVGILAFSDKPHYLAYREVRVLAALALIVYSAALLFGLRTFWPRRYEVSRHNLTEMRAALAELRERKAADVRRAYIAFAMGSLLLMLLLVDLLLIR